MTLPPEIEKYANDLIQSYLLQEQALAFSPEKLQSKLSASENVCHLLEEQVFELESRLKKITTQIEQRKAEVKMNTKALLKCMEDKAAMVVSCKRLASLCDELERKCSSCERELSRYMESPEENKRENEELSAISQQEQLPEEAEIEALEKDKIGQAMHLVKAEQEVASLSLENRLLEHKHDKLLVLERFEEPKEIVIISSPEATRLENA
ncbi:SKIP interacting protein 16 [Rhynchospora pubera]|uniref:SKIP interacting protein 16 n=1 Tax=Rhynchospora pubera TaxID=906938 RepID=A0AAV8GE99_9POAL|nr:SKIP interacting protein 16 [Rhynchospora pubera]